MKSNFKNKILFFFILFLFLGGKIFAQTTEGSERFFYIEKSFDISSRNKIEAVLVKITPKLYFYIEKSVWNTFSSSSKNEILKKFEDLSNEFESYIYPKITSFFGLEWKPGIDNDERITLLFLPMKKNEGGYFRTHDEYEKWQIPNSNEREMLYLSLDLISSPQEMKAVLAHELIHLITFNQKNKMFNVEEETWLNEARADYASTLLGYKTNILKTRIKDFITFPTDSITEWRNTEYDYASASLFIHYLVDHYGVEILTRSLKSSFVGIESINYALQSLGTKENFQDAFTNWKIANVLNNCLISPRFCYKNEDLKGFRLAPSTIFLPISGEASLSISNVTKNWAGNWQKFIGGNSDLNLKFSGYEGVKFRVPYILEDKEGNYYIEFLNLDKNQKGELNIPNFSQKYKSLIIIPSVQDKMGGYDGQEVSFPFSYVVKVGGNKATRSEEILIKELLQKIELLKKQIAELQAKMAQPGTNILQISCKQILNNLYFGTFGKEVKCLQEFLKNQGLEIYPEGLITGYFGSLTKTAVIRFQEKYASEILEPLGLTQGTGFVGSLTRKKINQLLVTSDSN